MGHSAGHDIRGFRDAEMTEQPKPETPNEDWRKLDLHDYLTLIAAIGFWLVAFYFTFIQPLLLR